jgi:hypothetical protein
MSKKSDWYRDKAKECELIAVRALEPSIRSAYQDIACAWRELAENTEGLGIDRNMTPEVRQLNFSKSDLEN